MEKRVIVILLTMGLLVLINTVDGKNQDRKIVVDEVDRRLQLLNKRDVKRTIKSEDGDIIDCVDIYKQPAFDHPALKNHTIQMKPSFNISMEITNTSNNESSSSSLSMSQTWQKSGSCPNRTIPIRRIRREDLLRAASLEEFGKKPPLVSHHLTNDPAYAKNTPFSSSNNSYGPYQAIPLPNRSTAVLFTAGLNYIGATAVINTWNPNVETNEDYTTAQIWLQSGPANNAESVESGWTVNPKLYGDKRTRVFVYWTSDGYKSKGCFDLTCPGFVQVSPDIALGAVITPTSVEGGTQYGIPFGIFLDPFSGNWWLKIRRRNVEVPVGYWPSDVFGYLKHSAIFTAWGGEVYSPNVMKTPHTKTEMGSGESARMLWGSACFILHPRIMDYSLQLKYPERVGTRADEYYCYDAFNYRKGEVGEPVFYFGGPGQRPPYCN